MYVPKSFSPIMLQKYFKAKDLLVMMWALHCDEGVFYISVTCVVSFCPVCKRAKG